MTPPQPMFSRYSLEVMLQFLASMNPSYQIGLPVIQELSCSLRNFELLMYDVVPSRRVSKKDPWHSLSACPWVWYDEMTAGDEVVWPKSDEFFAASNPKFTNGSRSAIRVTPCYQNHNID
nr:hypothetical protein CFP56_79095 [Quercus suber]